MTRPLVCVTVAAGTVEELQRHRDAADSADIVELRLDHLRTPDAAAALAGRRKPAIVTCRPAWEGGRFDGSESERCRILTAAVEAGAEFVDVEFAAGFATDIIRRRRGRGVIVSAHLFGPVPADLAQRADALWSSGAEVVKLAVEARCLGDARRLFALAEARPLTGDGPDRVLIAMGEPGVTSRVLAARLGNRWTYAGEGIAPGQVPAAKLLEEYRFDRIRPDSALFGVVGNPVLHSLSPRMHNTGFAARGLNAAYLPLHASNAADFVTFAREMGLRGASVTAPFKVALMHHVDEIEPLAGRVGAINTIVVRDGRWIGGNTDVHGVRAPLRSRLDVRGLRATILGAGGAARAAAVALGDDGAEVTICARRPEAARAVAAAVGGGVGPFPPRAGTWDVLVNTVPPAEPAENPVAGAPLDGRLVFDLAYVPRETPLLRDARRAGRATIDGIEMLVAQAERQFELWTGEAPPAGLFRAAADGPVHSSPQS